MTSPTVTETTVPPQPLDRDPFIDDVTTVPDVPADVPPPPRRRRIWD